MPEGPEIETKELQETIDEIREERADEERERAWTRWVSLSTALLAVIAAIAALRSGTFVNEALMKKNESVLMQAQASDQWSYYQAKGVKRNGAQQTADLMSANPALAHLAGKYAAAAEQYRKDQDGIASAAKKLEAERDEAGKQADALLERHHSFAFCVTFTQVAIALSAIAALTRRKPVWHLSLLVGVAGMVWFGDGLLR
jgi:hypothetical protein